MQKSIRHKWVYQYSPAVVWEYLTNKELISQWLMKNDFLPVVGRQFHFFANPVCELDFDGIIYCMVLEVVPGEKLSYSWKCGPGNGEINLDSIVTWTLTQEGTGTILSLDHSGFRELEHYNMFTIMDAGWLKHMKNIEEKLNSNT